MQHRRSATIIKANLYNKRIRDAAIGHSITYCTLVERNRLVTRQICRTIFSFPLGTILTAGMVSSPVYYRVAIIGGTGYYKYVGGGQLTGQAYNLDPQREWLHFEIKGL